MQIHRSEGFALTGYDIPGCMEDGAWMLLENSSVAVAVVVAVAVAVAVAHPDFENVFLGTNVIFCCFPLDANRNFAKFWRI